MPCYAKNFLLGEGNHIQNRLQHTYAYDTMMVMALDLENFDEVKLKGEELYKSLEGVHCPYFNEKIHFNAKGLEHLKFKKHDRARTRQDQYMRFKLLHLAPKVLRISKTLQGKWETKSFERVRVHSRTETVMKDIEYYEFVAVMEEVRVKIIVKRIADGELFFWSIIPYWGVNKKTKKRKLHSGYPEED